MNTKLFSAIKELGRQSFLYAIGDFFSKGIAFLLVPLYTSNLTPSDYGILSICLAILSVLTPALSLALGGAITRFYVEFEDPKEAKKFVGSIFLSILGIGLMLTLALNVLGYYFADTLFKSVPFDPYLKITIWASYLGIIVVIPGALLRIQENAVSYGVLTYGNNVLKIAFSVYFVAYMNMGVSGALQGIFWANLLFSLVGFLIMRKHMSWSISLDWLRRALRFSLPLIPHMLFHWILNLSDRLVLDHFVSPHEVGVYSLGYQVSLIVSVVITALNTAWAPYLVNRHKMDDAKTLFAQLSTYFIFISSYVALVVILFGKYIVTLIAPPSYYEAINVIIPVTIGYLFLGMYYVAINHLFIANMTGRIALLSAIAALVNILLNLAFIPSYGMMAAAWSTTISYFVLFLGVFSTSTKLKLAKYEYRRIITIIGAAIIITIVSMLMTNFSLLLFVTFNIFLLLLFPFLLLALGFLNEKEKQLLSKVFYARLKA